MPEETFEMSNFLLGRTAGIQTQAIHCHTITNTKLLKGKFTQKERWSEMNEVTKTRWMPLTVCKYLVWFSRYFILKFQMEDAMTVTF